MKKVNLSKELKERLENIAKKYNLKVLILFGSRAKGNEKKTSDWDFAFYPQKRFNIDDNMNLFDDIITILNDEKVDLVDLEQSNKLHVINNIFQTGSLIYEKRYGLFINMKWSAWMDYQDFQHYYERQFEVSRKCLNEMVEDGC